MERLKKFFWNMYIQDAKGEPISTLEKHIPEKGVILDAGSGEGQYNSLLNSANRTIICFDIKAPLKRSSENDFIIGSVERLPFKNGVFDFVYCLSVLQFVKNDEGCFKEFYRTIKTGGRSVITLPTKYSLFHLLRKLELLFDVYEFPAFNVPKHHYYSKKRIKQLSATFFSRVSVRGYNFNFIYPRLYLLIRNLYKKYHFTDPNKKTSKVNSGFDFNLVKNLNESLLHYSRIFDLFRFFSPLFAWHYVIVLDKK